MTFQFKLSDKVFKHYTIDNMSTNKIQYFNGKSNKSFVRDEPIDLSDFIDDADDVEQIWNCVKTWLDTQNNDLFTDEIKKNLKFRMFENNVRFVMNLEQIFDYLCVEFKLYIQTTEDMQDLNITQKKYILAHPDKEKERLLMVQYFLPQNDIGMYRKQIEQLYKIPLHHFQKDGTNIFQFYSKLFSMDLSCLSDENYLIAGSASLYYYEITELCFESTTPKWLPGDIDFWLTGRQFTKFNDNVSKTLIKNNNVKWIKSSMKMITICLDTVTLQFIRTEHTKENHIWQSITSLFDLPVCQVGYTSTEGFCSPAFMRSMTTPNEIFVSPAVSKNRIEKYKSRGYNIVQKNKLNENCSMGNKGYVGNIFVCDVEQFFLYSCYDDVFSRVDFFCSIYATDDLTIQLIDRDEIILGEYQEDFDNSNKGDGTLSKITGKSGILNVLEKLGYSIYCEYFMINVVQKLISQKQNFHVVLQATRRGDTGSCDISFVHKF